MESLRTDCGVLSDILWIKRGQCMNLLYSKVDMLEKN